MKTSKRKMRSIGIFALVLVMLMSAILPLSAAGSASTKLWELTS